MTIVRFFVIVLVVLVIAAMVYSHRQRQKRYVQTISPITEHPDLTGDGAWINEPAKYPNGFRNYREPEQRGF